MTQVTVARSASSIPLPRRMARFLRVVSAMAALLVLAVPAMAQWTRIANVPVTNVFSVSATGDTLVASTDTTVFVSTDAGSSWRPNRKVAAGVALVDAALLRNGRLYAGTGGQGVFVSDDFGSSWQAINQGLVGGFLDTQLDIAALAVRGDSLYAGTFGAGVYVRRLSSGGAWSHFGEEFEPNQASNVRALVAGGPRLLAGAGGNGSVFHRDPGEPEWTISWLDNIGLHPGVQVQSIAWTGTGWVASTLFGVFHSASGQEPWTRTVLPIGALQHGTFAVRGRQLFAAFDILNACEIEHSDDDGATWQPMDDLPQVFVFSMAAIGNELFAGRGDGLWRRSTATLSASGEAVAGVRLRLLGRQPAGDELQFRIESPEAGDVTLELFDVSGRRALAPARASWPAGTHELSMSARTLAPGVYAARLETPRGHAAVRVVHVR